MVEIERYQPSDRAAVQALYGRVFGAEAATASAARWQWQYQANPHVSAGQPPIWLAREGAEVIGQYATMPVRLWVRGQVLTGSWGMDVMVAPERQRQGLGERLFETWDREVDAALGLGLSVASHRLFRKLAWPDVGPVPCLIKPLRPEALENPRWPRLANWLIARAVFPALARARRRTGPGQQAAPLARFDRRFDGLWRRVAPRLGLAVCRDADYLNWKFVDPPHVRYELAALGDQRTVHGYVVYRHRHEPRGLVTLLVDLLADPGDASSAGALLAWVEASAVAAGSSKIRCFALHRGLRRALRGAGYYRVRSTMEFVVKVNAVTVPREFYDRTGDWHVTLGDSDQDR